MTSEGDGGKERKSKEKREGKEEGRSASSSLRWTSFVSSPHQHLPLDTITIHETRRYT